ncbi:hypothetical protein [Flavobacterium sp. SM2513]|uniref:hypothetical protein n=1 Tax=Flavobacterium sp. SM2513 TaxID=3424766 RepID=UPI003D7F53AB
MSTKHQPLVAIPQEVIDQVTQKLEECKDLVHPYTQGLTAKQRMSMFKMSNLSQAIVLKTKSYMKTNPEFIPYYLDQNDFYRDELIARQLQPIANLSKQLSTDINDTAMLAGSNTMKKVQMYYGQVLEGFKKGVESSRVIYEDLSKRFAKQKRTPLSTPKNK